ncbi:MAG: MoaD/ThiS family protein [Acetobacteraceae bacterium]
MRAPVRVHLPTPLIALFPAAPAELELPAATLAELIAGLDQRFPGMRGRLADSTPRIRRHINIFVDGERIPLQARLEPGAEVFVMTAISGG